jgi:Co/Zn/Cd efflux system component
MHTESLDRWQHDHIFGQDQQRVGERRTLIVIAVTATMMVVEITTGIQFGSMALLADGLHMGSHAVALLIDATSGSASGPARSTRWRGSPARSCSPSSR